METFVAVAVGVGNLGRQGRPRKPMVLWIAELNQLLSKLSRITILSSYGHTGNFIVRSAASKESISTELRIAMGVPSALLTLGELSSVMNLLDAKNEADTTEYRRTPGAAFLVSGTPTLQALSDTERAGYSRINGSVIAISKRDALTLGGILDRSRREGGWGAIAGDVGRQLGGKWTARSMRTLSGALKQANSAASSS
jgi:hypothetical protein